MSNKANVNIYKCHFYKLELVSGCGWRVYSNFTIIYRSWKTPADHKTQKHKFLNKYLYNFMSNKASMKDNIKYI